MPVSKQVIGSTSRSGLRDPEKFFAIPHEAQLATVRKLTDGGEGVAKLISYAVEHQLKDGRISEVELFEILSDYLDKPEFKNQYKEDPLNYDGWSKYVAGKDIEALWELVLKLPEDISHVLIEHLPENARLSNGIPKHVLDGMSNRQLETLFFRSDIGLESFRKQKLFEAAQRDGEEKDDAIDGMRTAAITHAFDLTIEEFAGILAKPDKPRVKTLKELSMVAGDLRLCLFEAIHDALFASEVSPSDYEDAEWAMRSFERKLEKLRGWPDKRDKELKELRLYRLAMQAVPWKKGEKGYPPSGELAFLEETIVEGDTWATFAAFSRKWGQAYHRTKGLEKYLPKILEAGEEDDFSLDEDVIDDTEPIADRIANKESEPFAKEEESTPTKVLGKLAGMTVTQEKMLEAVNAIKTEFTELRYLQGKTLEAVNAAKAELTEFETFLQMATRLYMDRNRVAGRVVNCEAVISPHSLQG